jgi:thiol:disulfide interchange protein DsbC
VDAIQSDAGLNQELPMKTYAFAVLSCFSLAACAQSADSSAQGRKINVASATPAATKPSAEPAFTAGSPEARVRGVLKELNPKLHVDSIAAAPIPGFRQVVAGGQVVYVSDDGKYLFQGGLLDIAKQQDLSEVALTKVRGEVLKSVPAADRIVYGPVGAAPKHSVVVLTDVNCGYCRKFHNDMAEYTKRGIEVQYLAFPRAGLGSADYRTMVSVWCASDRNKALTDAKNDRPVPAKTCTTPVDMQYNAGQRMGLEGTPMILTSDGNFLGGYLPPDALLQRLQQVAAQAAKKGV